VPRRTPNGIAVRRARKGLGQKHLAKRLKTDVPRISQLELGYMLPTRAELDALREVLDVRPSELYGPKALALIRSEE
jgi:transcriptional regulator with XRE-family HTH domain